MSYSRLVQSHHEDGHQVTKSGNLWQSGGEAEQVMKMNDKEVDLRIRCKEEIAERKEKEATPPMTPTQVKPGVEVFIDAMIRQVFPVITHEVKELYKYCRQNGPLSRQNGESMQQYISRCSNLLAELDQELNLSEEQRENVMKELPGLYRQEKTIIKASIGNAQEGTKVAEPLVAKHPRIQDRTTGGKEKPKSG